MAEDTATGTGPTDAGTTDATAGTDQAAAPAAPDTTTDTGAATDTQATEATSQAPAVPETYDLKLPDGSTVDPAILERTAATARELGLSQEHAQKVTDTIAAEVAAHEAALLKSYSPGGEGHEARVAEWKALALADKEIGGTPEQLAASEALRDRVLGTFADEGTLKDLEASGLKNYPGFVRLLARIGRATLEDKTVTGNPAGPGDTPEARARRRFPTMAAEG